MTLFFFISKFLNTHYTVREFWKKKGSEIFFSPRYIEEAQTSLVSCVISHHRKPTLILGKETAENKNETNSFQTFYAPFSSDSRQQTMVTRETWWCPEGQCIGIQVEKSSFRQDTFLSLLRGRNGWQQTVRKLYEMLRGIIVKEQTRENRQTKQDEKFYIEYRRYEFFFSQLGFLYKGEKRWIIWRQQKIGLPSCGGCPLNSIFCIIIQSEGMLPIGGKYELERVRLKTQNKNTAAGMILYLEVNHSVGYDKIP